MPFTAFASEANKHRLAARLIVRRGVTSTPITSNATQRKLFAVWHHHAVFTDSALPMPQAEADHRRHAIIEEVIAGTLGFEFPATNSAWLVLASMAFDRLPTTGTSPPPCTPRRR